jgi:hypothetical protein
MIFINSLLSKLNIKIPDFNLLQESEIKHGRVAMLSAFGFGVQEIYHPFFPNIYGPSITHLVQVFYNLLPEDFYWIAFTMIIIYYIEMNSFYKVDDMGSDINDKMKIIELNHGRLAMFAIIGMIVQELKTGRTLVGL